MRKEKRSEILHDAMQYLDDEIIEQVGKIRTKEIENAQINTEKVGKSDVEHCSNTEIAALSDENNRKMETKNTKKAYWRRGITIAASISLFFVGGWTWNNVLAPSVDRFSMEEMASEQKEGDSTEDRSEHSEQYSDIQAENEEVDDMSGLNENHSDGFAGEQESLEEGITLPALQVDLGKPEREDVAADMLGLFIYQGRCYVQTTDYFEDNLDFLGAKLGTATGYIDEWTPEDGYVELAGTVVGDFYEVKGVEPEFMLAILHEWDDERMAELYVNNNGITLYKGADIIDKYLHLKENYTEVSCLTYAQLMDAWSLGASVDMKTKKISKKHHDLIDQFIDAYSEGKFVKDNFNGGDGNNDHVYHLYFTMDSGVRLHFSLIGDGYVQFEGLYGACVKIDMDTYNAMVELLKEASKK